MKLTNEMCQEAFNELDLDLKRWIICVTQELNASEQEHPDWPDEFTPSAMIVQEQSDILVRAAIAYKYENGRYYDMHTKAAKTAAFALRFLLNAPDKPFNETSPFKLTQNRKPWNKAAIKLWEIAQHLSGNADKYGLVSLEDFKTHLMQQAQDLQLPLSNIEVSTWSWNGGMSIGINKKNSTDRAALTISIKN